MLVTDYFFFCDLVFRFNCENVIMDTIFKSDLSWEISSRSVYVLQKRLFKAVYVGDLFISFGLQRLILKSSSSRLVSIRYVTQTCPNRKIPGVDGISALSFTERFELNECLKYNYTSWKNDNPRKISILQKNGSIKYFNIYTIADRAWQFLIKLALEPAHEALYHPTSFGFRSSSTYYTIQNFISSNLSFSSFGSQKRVLLADFSSSLNFLRRDYLLKKLIVPRSIKFCLNRFLLTGYEIKYSDSFELVSDLSSLLANIVLTGIEDIHSCARFGAKIVFFLKPNDNEVKIFNDLHCFFVKICEQRPVITFNLVTSFQGFDFLGWHFKVNSSKKCIIVPSDLNYREFLLRVKRIVNNSNFGSEVCDKRCKKA